MSARQLLNDILFQDPIILAPKTLSFEPGRDYLLSRALEVIQITTLQRGSYVEKIRRLPTPLARFLPERRPLHTLPGPFSVPLQKPAEPGLRVPYSKVLA